MATQEKSDESIIDPDLPIVDPHHHLWFLSDRAVAGLKTSDSPFAPVFIKNARYLLDEFLADVNTGHNIRATVYVDAGAMYRSGGPDAMKSVGEVEFVNGVAAMAASGAFGDVEACAGIVGHVDLRLGDAAEEVLRAHIQAGNGRYRGVRDAYASDPDPVLAGAGGGHQPHLLADKAFRAGFKWLQKLGLSYDAWLFEPQLSDLTDLANAFPETQIILDHVGGPLGIGSYGGRREERFPIWKTSIRALAKCRNVTVKLGGLGMSICGFQSSKSSIQGNSEQLAAEWKPYIETCIEAFGADHCMFESNFPIDSASCSYPVIWNAFKRLTRGASKEEKTALFSGTAARVYRLSI